LLPSEPKIFHGRESEILNILQLFKQETPRITILGAGGMGKTSLARAVLHHPEITLRYECYRYFITCDSTATKVELAALIGEHLGLKPGKDLTHSVIHHFSSSPHSLLILDNLETLWEPVESRAEIEEFLSLLTDVAHLALLVHTSSLFINLLLISLLGHNARSRKTCQSTMDSAIPAAFETLETRCCSTNISRYCRCKA
jgi:Cdc6-like AAA superfamily ATPase